MQIRSSVAPTPLVSKNEKPLKSKGLVTKYVEGESEESEGEGIDEQMDIEDRKSTRLNSSHSS